MYEPTMPPPHSQPVTETEYAPGDYAPLYEAERDARLQADERIRDLEQQLERARSAEWMLDALMEYLPEGITIAEGSEARVKRVSRFLEQITGRERETLEDTAGSERAALWGILAGEGGAHAREEDLPLTRAIRQGEIVTDEEWVIERADGEKVRIQCNAGPVLNERGEITGGVIAWRDVTERRRLEGDVARAQLLDVAYDAMIVHSLDNRISFWNRAAEQLYGWSREEAIGEVAYKLLHTHFPHSLEQVLETIGAAGHWQGEIRHTARDGREIIVESSWSLQRDAKGQPIAILQANRDITERKRMERALRESEERYRFLAEITPQFVWMTDAEGTPIYWNQQFLEYTGLSSETIASEWANVLHPEEREVVSRAWALSARTGQPYEMQERLRRHDGEYRWFLGRGLPLQNEQGEVTRWFGTCTDIQGMMEAQAEIEALNERLQTAMTETHHRVKNNLQVIAALIELHSGSEESAVPSSEVRGLGQHVRGLAAIHDLLTAQSKAGLTSDTLSVRAALERLLPLLQATLDERRIRASLTEARIPSQQATALAVVTNELVSNAIKHAPEGDIVVTLTVEDGWARLTVEDEGPGFPPGFDPATAAHTGLELVQMLASWDLAGMVYFENRPEGGGRVVITFPLNDRANAPTG